ncbi:MAG: hypothetical protein ABIR16_01525 [Dokdonella sp.]
MSAVALPNHLQVENAIDVLDALMKVSKSAAASFSTGEIRTFADVALDLVNVLRSASGGTEPTASVGAQNDLWSLGKIETHSRKIVDLLFIVSGSVSCEGDDDIPREAIETLSLHAAGMAEDIAKACADLATALSDSSKDSAA